jgi:signal transduction histidine kinase
LPSAQEGSGLGLWLARELAQKMGGQLWCASDVGESTTFFVALPAA